MKYSPFTKKPYKLSPNWLSCVVISKRCCQSSTWRIRKQTGNAYYRDVSQYTILKRQRISFCGSGSSIIVNLLISIHATENEGIFKFPAICLQRSLGLVHMCTSHIISIQPYSPSPDQLPLALIHLSKQYQSSSQGLSFHLDCARQTLG